VTQTDPRTSLRREIIEIEDDEDEADSEDDGEMPDVLLATCTTKVKVLFNTHQVEGAESYLSPFKLIRLSGLSTIPVVTKVSFESKTS
jgi:hypothetical protein